MISGTFLKQFIFFIFFGTFCLGCDKDLPLFQGFGIFLGSLSHLAVVREEGVVPLVVDKIYSDLGIRYFRTSYESEFSLSPHNYGITCATPYLCTWMDVVSAIGKYDDVSLFASIWSPPHYMKNKFLNTLKEDREQDYHFYIKNITAIIKEKFGVSVEKVSPVNEPENLFAPWEHTNMGPSQLCRMVRDFEDPIVSLCPENSYFWVSELYANYSDAEKNISCKDSCEVYATHAYALNIDYWSPYRLFAYFDNGRYNRFTKKPIWMTEVSSTFPRIPLISNQMKEALDLGSNIVNFVGTTCVQRYYFWSMFTLKDSGESLIWGNFGSDSKGNVTLYYPKTYYTYRHFTTAAFGGEKKINDCDIQGYDKDLVSCIIFSNPNSSVTVFVNHDSNPVLVLGEPSCNDRGPLCCTTEEFDWFCLELQDFQGANNVNGSEVILPAKSVCSCPSVSGPLVNLQGRRDIYDNRV